MASFTYELATTVGEREIVALHPAGEPGPYPAEVRHRIRGQERQDYAYMAHSLNQCGVDAVSLQYERGIWGGDGAWVLDFARALNVPMVATLHNVDPSPTAPQRDVVRELADIAKTTVVMSNGAADRLLDTYGLAQRQVEVIPYGVADLPIVAPESIKPRLGLRESRVILSFGLLAARKGFEMMIDALPAVVASFPTARYVILGATSLVPPESDGIAYLSLLRARVEALGLNGHVTFVDRYVGRVELGSWLQATDVVVTPSIELRRSESGTLAYAMGAGKAIVSTATDYAREMLADGCGMIVPSAGPESLATAVSELLTDSEARASMGRRAHEATRKSVWWATGHRYRQVLERAAQSVGPRPARDRSGRRPAPAVI